MAQTNHPDVVVAVKADLEQRGIALAGACGAFEITKRVAWQLRDEGAGLLDKPTGNNCQGFAVDIIAYPDGSIYDILVASGDANGPAWNSAGVVGADRYRVPIDPGDVVQPPAPPPPPAPPAVPDDPQLTTLIASLDATMRALDATRTVLEALNARLDTLAKNGLRVHL